MLSGSRADAELSKKNGMSPMISRRLVARLFCEFFRCRLPETPETLQTYTTRHTHLLTPNRSHPHTPMDPMPRGVGDFLHAFAVSSTVPLPETRQNGPEFGAKNAHADVFHGPQSLLTDPKLPVRPPHAPAPPPQGRPLAKELPQKRLEGSPWAHGAAGAVRPLEIFPFSKTQVRISSVFGAHNPSWGPTWRP